MADEAGVVDAPDVIAKGGKVAASVPLANRVRVIACGAIAREIITMRTELVKRFNRDR